MKKNLKSLFLLVPFLFGTLSEASKAAVTQTAARTLAQLAAQQQSLISMKKTVPLLDQTGKDTSKKSSLTFSFSPTIKKEVNAIFSAPNSPLSLMNARLARDGTTEIPNFEHSYIPIQLGHGSDEYLIAVDNDSPISKNGEIRIFKGTVKQEAGHNWLVLDPQTISDFEAWELTTEFMLDNLPNCPGFDKLGLTGVKWKEEHSEKENTLFQKITEAIQKENKTMTINAGNLVLVEDITDEEGTTQERITISRSLNIGEKFVCAEPHVIHVPYETFTGIMQAIYELHVKPLLSTKLLDLPDQPSYEFTSDEKNNKKAMVKFTKNEDVERVLISVLNTTGEIEIKQKEIIYHPGTDLEIDKDAKAIIEIKQSAPTEKPKITIYLEKTIYDNFPQPNCDPTKLNTETKISRYFEEKRQSNQQNHLNDAHATLAGLGGHDEYLTKT